MIYISSSCEKKLCNHSTIAPLDNSVRTIWTLNRNQSQKDCFFCCIKNQPALKRKVGEKMKRDLMYKSIMKYLTDKDLSLNAKGFLSMILFNAVKSAL